MRTAGIGKWGWVLVMLLFAAGFIAFFATVLGGVLGGQASLYRVSAPGETQVKLGRAGRYTLYLEYSRTVDSLRVNRPRGVEELQVALSGPDGKALELVPARDERYAIRRLVGEAFRSFEVATPGDYHLTASYPDGAGPEVGLVFKRSYREQVLQSLAKGFGILLLTLTAVVTTIWWLTQRAQRHADIEFRL